MLRAQLNVISIINKINIPFIENLVEILQNTLNNFKDKNPILFKNEYIVSIYSAFAYELELRYCALFNCCSNFTLMIIG